MNRQNLWLRGLEGGPAERQFGCEINSPKYSLGMQEKSAPRMSEPVPDASFGIPVSRCRFRRYSRPDPAHRWQGLAIRSSTFLDEIEPHEFQRGRAGGWTPDALELQQVPLGCEHRLLGRIVEGDCCGRMAHPSGDMNIEAAL